MRPSHLARYLARTLVLSRTVKLVSLGRAGLCFALAGEEGIPEVRSPPLLVAEVPEMLEDCDGRLGRLHRWQRRRRRCQRWQGLRLAQHLIEPVGPDDRQLRIVAPCGQQRQPCGYQRQRHVTAKQSQQPDRHL